MVRIDRASTAEVARVGGRRGPFGAGDARLGPLGHAAGRPRHAGAHPLFASSMVADAAWLVVPVRMSSIFLRKQRFGSVLWLSVLFHIVHSMNDSFDKKVAVIVS